MDKKVLICGEQSAGMTALVLVVDGAVEYGIDMFAGGARGGEYQRTMDKLIADAESLYHEGHDNWSDDHTDRFGDLDGLDIIATYDGTWHLNIPDYTGQTSEVIPRLRRIIDGDSGDLITITEIKIRVGEALTAAKVDEHNNEVNIDEVCTLAGIARDDLCAIIDGSLVCYGLYNVDALWDAVGGKPDYEDVDVTDYVNSAYHLIGCDGNTYAADTYTSDDPEYDVINRIARTHPDTIALKEDDECWGNTMPGEETFVHLYQLPDGRLAELTWDVIDGSAEIDTDDFCDWDHPDQIAVTIAPVPAVEDEAEAEDASIIDLASVDYSKHWDKAGLWGFGFGDYDPDRCEEAEDGQVANLIINALIANRVKPRGKYKYGHWTMECWAAGRGIACNLRSSGGCCRTMLVINTSDPRAVLATRD